MEFKQFVSMNIAIIGNTEAAVKYAIAFANAGHDCYMACSERYSLEELDIPAACSNIYFSTIEDAAAIADLILVATEPKDVREAAYWLGDVRRKVIIDMTANVPTPEEALVNTTSAIEAITGAQHVIKVFSTMGYEDLLKPLFGGKKVDMLLLSNSRKAREITKIMAVEIGLNSFSDFGGEENLPLFDEMTKVWRRMRPDAQPAPAVLVK